VETLGIYKKWWAIKTKELKMACGKKGGKK